MATSDEQMSRHRPRAVVLLSSEPHTASETALVPRGFAARSSRMLSEKTQDCSQSSYHLQSLFLEQKFFADLPFLCMGK